MNPLGAFSFSKIIKSLVPGTLLLFYFLGLHEVTGLLLYGDHPEPLAILLEQNAPATVFLAVLIPTALILGFFLNTAWWLWFGGPFKRWTLAGADRRLQVAYDAISGCARHTFREVIERGEATEPIDHTDDLPVQTKAYLLPLLQREKYAQVNEAYFAWYEFQVNSALALVVALVVHLLCLPFLALEHSWLGRGWLQPASLGLAATLASGLLVWFLLVAARANLDKHHQFMLWFLLGSIEIQDGSFIVERTWRQEADDAETSTGQGLRTDAGGLVTGSVDRSPVIVSPTLSLFSFPPDGRGDRRRPDPPDRE